MPTELRAQFRIVTPMFLGGADQRCDGTLRPPSVKGALRFWWRALNWPRLRAGSNDADALSALHCEEARLFGLAANEQDGAQTGGQGSFLMTVRPIGVTRLKTVEQKRVHPSFRDVTAARYLGYGLMVPFATRDRPAAELDRDCIVEDQRFELRLRFRGTAEPSVVQAVKALGLLGGLGSRARHGMGSIALEALTKDNHELFEPPRDPEGYRALVRDMADVSDAANPFASATDEPPYTAFWNDARIDLLTLGENPYQTLDAFATAMMRYRSWGRSLNGNVLPDGSISEKRFQDDHDWYRQPTSGWRTAHPNFHPERAMFGLPHNYAKQDWAHVTPANFERRASALLLHVHPLGNQFIGVTTFLPACFLPPGDQINAGATNVPVVADWSIITDLLDGKIGNPPALGAPDRFPGKRSILP